MAKGNMAGTPKNRNGKRAPSGGSLWWRHQRLGPRGHVSALERVGQEWEGPWKRAHTPSSPSSFNLSNGQDFMPAYKKLTI